MNSSLSFRFGVALFLSHIGMQLSANEAGPVVELPPYVVEESLTPPWRYTSIPGVEVISRGPDNLTRQLLTSHYRLHELLSLMIPRELQLQRQAPINYVFYLAGNQPPVTREMVTSIEKQERETLKNNPETADNNPPDVNVGYMPNFRFWDQDSLAIFFVIDPLGDDNEGITLAAGYVRYLLESRTPALPMWYIEGMMDLYPTAEFTEPALTTSSGVAQPSTFSSKVILNPMVWVSPKQSKALQKKPIAPSEMIPLETLFTPSGINAGKESVKKLWRSESALFIRWALDPRKEKDTAMGAKSTAVRSRTEALKEFIRRSSLEPVTEKVFQECFGLSYAEAEIELRAYLPNALRRTFTLYPDKPIVAPKISLRNATTLEISRIKGTLARLEIDYVRARYPALTSAYIGQARRILHTAYDQGSRDPQLLAELGLCECDADNDSAALPFLRAATAAGVIHPRAYYELARIEFAQSNEKDVVASETIAYDLLAKAREQSPALAEVYELYLKIWIQRQEALDHSKQAIIDEGLRFYPRSYRLLLASAIYHGMNSQKAEAEALITRGLDATSDPQQRSKLTRLRKAL